MDSSRATAWLGYFSLSGVLLFVQPLFAQMPRDALVDTIREINETARVDSVPARQVHLDFHTSEHIPDVGKEFDPKQFQEALKLGRVQSINVFATCWHGWSYYPTDYGHEHPALQHDLLGAQIEAAHAIGVRAPVYFAAGTAEATSEQRPEWRVQNRDGSVARRKPLPAGPPDTPRPPGTWTYMAPVDGYLSQMLRQTEEICARYDVDGFWYDGIYVHPVAYNPELLGEMKAEGFDPNDDEAVFLYGVLKWQRFMRTAADIIHRHHPKATVFFNSTNFVHSPERTWELRNFRFNTHHELEDLPTTSWGWYDKFPLRAKLFHLTGKPLVAMSGKFHQGWGEFGGFKHPDAMRCEAATMIAFGAACSIGDQLHPSGSMDLETYRLLGEAYGYVEQIEEFGIGGRPVSPLGVWFCDSLAHDEGVVNMLLETQTDFVFVDSSASLDSYEVIILPGGARLAGEEAARLKAYQASGGKLLVISNAALNAARDGFLLDVGAEYLGGPRYDVDYTLPLSPLGDGLVQSPILNYHPALRVQPGPETQVLARLFEPYFSRTLSRYMSHLNTPPQREPAEQPAIIRHDGTIYFANPVDQSYQEHGARLHRDLFTRALAQLYLRPMLRVLMPSSARVSLLHQPGHQRYIAHLLYGPPLKRGAVHVIEDLVPLHDVRVELRLPVEVRSLRLIPDNVELPFERDGDVIRTIIPKMQMHAAIVAEYTR